MISFARTAFAAAALSIAMIAAAAASTGWTASLSGRVVDVQSLKPIAGATIRIYTNDGSRELGKAVSDAQGSFLIGGLRGGDYRLHFQKAGYQRTVVAGIYVRPGERLIEAAPIAMYANGVPLPNMTAARPCGALVDPQQTADVYVVCSE